MGLELRGDDDPGQPDGGAHVGQDPVAGLYQADLRVFREDAQVARQGQLQARAVGLAAHGGDAGAAQAWDPAEGPPPRSGPRRGCAGRRAVRPRRPASRPWPRPGRCRPIRLAPLPSSPGIGGSGRASARRRAGPAPATSAGSERCACRDGPGSRCRCPRGAGSEWPGCRSCAGRAGRAAGGLLRGQIAAVSSPGAPHVKARRDQPT
jgi:hypothetical protein